MPGLPRVCVVGVGLIGGSLGLALKRTGTAARVIGVSRPATIEAALALGALDEGMDYDALDRAVGQADVVVLATPIGRIRELVARLGAMPLPPGLLVTDVGSTKGEIVRDAARLLPRTVDFIGGHPMAGSERSGVEAADPFLFQNAIYVLCPGPGTAAARAEEFGRRLERLGARVLIMDAAEHDRTVAAVSHLPQLLAVGLVNHAAAAGNDALRLAAGGFRDMTRIASSPFGVWKDIIATNTPCIRAALEGFARVVADMAAALGSEELADAFARAALARSGIPLDTKGFLRPLAELLVVVEDRPGVILSIAAPLAEAGINIQDIEVLKVREDEGGTLRLAFRNREVSERARALLQARGFDVRHRQ